MARDKPADVDFPIHELLRQRWSTRAFDPRPLPPAAVGSLLEAARWAPSSYNAQPWRFLVARRDDNPVAYERMAALLFAGNRTWAGEAPLLILAIAATELPEGRGPNDHAVHDVGLAVALLTVQATAMGLFVHQLAGFDTTAAREIYAIPAGFEPVSILAIGYGGDPDDLDELNRRREQAPRRRLAFADFVYQDTWGQPAAMPDPPGEPGA